MKAIGNGESRKGLKIPHHSVGCNAIHRDHAVDHLICIDRRCLLEAVQGPNTERSIIYTRPEWINHVKDPRIRLVPKLPYKGNTRPDDPWHWGSGPYAVLLAATLDDEIELIGFDLYSKNSKVNNLYKDTANYSKTGSHAVDPSYWIYQISQLFLAFSDKYFIVYNTEDWQMPDLWKMDNVTFKTIDRLY